MSKRAKKITADILYIVVMLGILFGVWAVAAYLTDSEFVLPDIGKTFRALAQVVTVPNFWRGLYGTLLRSVIAYGISVVMFALLFYFGVSYRGFGRVVEPIISALRTLPTLALALMFAIWVGGYATPVILGVLVIMPILYSSSKARVATVERERKEICVILGANKWQTFRAVWFPQAAAALPESLATAFSYNIKAVIGAEILASTAHSLGMLMNQAYGYLQTAALIALTFIAVVLSVVSEAVIRVILKALLRKYSD